ncbi:MAG TPA: hypothetical protein VE911_07885, partial [Candidatus Nitrosopolaris sp.]|nr:hypothetical protein [Candidatus Nitrosopolaris sp.]
MSRAVRVVQGVESQRAAGRRQGVPWSRPRPAGWAGLQGLRPPAAPEPPARARRLPVGPEAPARARRLPVGPEA